MSWPVIRSISRDTIVKQRRKAKARPRAKEPEYDVFDSKGTISYGFCNATETICGDESPCCGLVKLYARMGLHRYNLLQGENYQLHLVHKYNLRKIFAAKSYYITFDAMDPATSLIQTFQTKVDVTYSGGFELKCDVARPREETKILPGLYFSVKESWYDWPTYNPFLKFDVAKKNSSLQEDDWIRLYLELAVARRTMDHDLSNLEILKVAKDTSGETATIYYIRYKDSCVARVGKDVDRIAIVRRSFDEPTGCFSLMGQHQSSKILAKKWRHAGV